MTKREFFALVKHAGMAVPEGAEEHLRGAAADENDPLLTDAFLADCARRGGLDDGELARLRGALDQIRSDKQLLRLSCVLRDDAHPAVLYQRACEFVRPEPKCLSGFAREAYALLFALSCLEKGLQALTERGIPKEEFEDVCRRMADRQIEKMSRTGSPAIDDYSWDMNFYACGIFLHDRLYFVPYRWEGPAAYRRVSDGKVTALWPAGSKVRRDGQLDGVNGVHDPQAFATTWADYQTITAYPVNPVGVIRQHVITIQKGEWLPALASGDMTLAAHIPGGEGYTPERWKSSMEKARAFFARWFPEIVTAGFWSESWLYDPTLYRLLPKDGRIMSVQRQFYNYPTMEGEAMAKTEVFGTADIVSVEPKTSLQRNLKESLLRGEHYHTTGMFVLHEDLPRFGEMPYQTEEDVADYLSGRGD